MAHQLNRGKGGSWRKKFSCKNEKGVSQTEEKRHFYSVRGKVAPGRKACEGEGSWVVREVRREVAESGQSSLRQLNCCLFALGAEGEMMGWEVDRDMGCQGG